MKLITALGLASTIATAGLVLSACQDVGHVYGPSDYGSVSQDELWSGEVRDVGTRRREIEIRTDDGRTRTLRYDGRTRVVYRRNEYPVANLGRGDLIVVRVQDGYGPPYAEEIRVRRSAQNRAELERLDGRVEYVNGQRGTFEMRDRDRRITVSMPNNSRRVDQERFRRLRSGDFVRIEGYFEGRDRFELETFL